MEEKNFRRVMELVERWDYEWGCGPWEDSLPEADEVLELNELTGQNWTAEDVRELCFEFSSHNSLEETAYFLFHGDYPPVTNVNLVFYRLKPGAVLDPQTVYEKYRLGNQMKALVPLPAEEITEALRALPGFREHSWNGYQPEGLRMDCLEQPGAWSDVHFWTFWYGGRNNPRQDHVLNICCRDLSEDQIQALLDVMADFEIPLRYREEDHNY